MKKMLLATALAPSYYGGCAQIDVYCSVQIMRSSTKVNHQRIISSFRNCEETVDAAKICGGAENVVKTETQQK